MLNLPLYLYQGAALPAPTLLYDYVLAQQGIIKRVNNGLVEAATVLAPLPADLPPLTGLSLKPYPGLGARLKLPRIPGELLRRALTVARQDVSQEFMFQIVYDPAAGYTLILPEQSGESVWVRYTNRNPTGVVLELHSHNTMPAFFSPQDDRDEQGGKFYAVMGRVQQEQPELALRLGLYGHWLPLLPDALFTDYAPFTAANCWWTAGADDEAEAATPGFLERFLPWRAR